MKSTGTTLNRRACRALCRAAGAPERNVKIVSKRSQALSAAGAQRCVVLGQVSASTRLRRPDLDDVATMRRERLQA
jgi:hypothetical protein